MHVYVYTKTLHEHLVEMESSGSRSMKAQLQAMNGKMGRHIEDSNQLNDETPEGKYKLQLYYLYQYE